MIKNATRPIRDATTRTPRPNVVDPRNPKAIPTMKVQIRLIAPPTTAQGRTAGTGLRPTGPLPRRTPRTRDCEGRAGSSLFKAPNHRLIRCIQSFANGSNPLLKMLHVDGVELFEIDLRL